MVRTTDSTRASDTGGSPSGVVRSCSRWDRVTSPSTTRPCGLASTVAGSSGRSPSALTTSGRAGEVLVGGVAADGDDGAQPGAERGPQAVGAVLDDDHLVAGRRRARAGRAGRCPARASWRAPRRRRTPRTPRPARRRPRARAPRGRTPRPTSTRPPAASPPRDASVDDAARCRAARASPRPRPSPCSARSSPCASARSGRAARRGRWAGARSRRTAGVNTVASRSLPPPIASRCPYSSSLQWIGRPASSNVRLNAGRCPSRSVSASTPSQSNTRAGLMRTPSRPRRTPRCARRSRPARRRRCPGTSSAGPTCRARGPRPGASRRSACRRPSRPSRC